MTRSDSVVAINTVVHYAVSVVFIGALLPGAAGTRVVQPTQVL